MIRLLIVASLYFLTISLSAQEIAITFDDAPTGDGPILSGKARTQKILAHLKYHDVEAVAFFVLTRHITSETEKRLHQYSKAGHLLANHSHSHAHIHTLGAQAYISDIKKADSVLRLYPGYQRWFRFPFLDEGRTMSARDSIRNALNEMNLINGYVTVDNYDWYLNHLLAKAWAKNNKVKLELLGELYVDHILESIRFYDSIALTYLGRSPRHVLLLHENDLAALFLGDLLKQLKEQGWKIISPIKAYEDAIASHVPDVLFNGQGRVAAIAREKGIPARQLVQESEDEVYLDELVRSRGVFE